SAKVRDPRCTTSVKARAVPWRTSERAPGTRFARLVPEPGVPFATWAKARAARFATWVRARARGSRNSVPTRARPWRTSVPTRVRPPLRWAGAHAPSSMRVAMTVAMPATAATVTVTPAAAATVTAATGRTPRRIGAGRKSPRVDAAAHSAHPRHVPGRHAPEGEPNERPPEGRCERARQRPRPGDHLSRTARDPYLDHRGRRRTDVHLGDAPHRATETGTGPHPLSRHPRRPHHCRRRARSRGRLTCPVAPRAAWGRHCHRRTVRDHRAIALHGPRAVYFEPAAVLGEQSVHLVLDVGGLGADGGRQAESTDDGAEFGTDLDVAAGEFVVVGRHLVGDGLAGPGVPVDDEAEAAVLAVGGGAVVGGERAPGADVGVVVVDVARSGVGMGVAAVHAAVGDDEAGRVGGHEDRGDAFGVVFAPALVERGPDDE